MTRRVIHRTEAAVTFADANAQGVAGTCPSCHQSLDIDPTSDQLPGLTERCLNGRCPAKVAARYDEWKGRRVASAH